MPIFTGSHINQTWWCAPQPTFSKSSAYTPPVQGCGALQLVNGAVCLNDWWFSELLPFICKKGLILYFKFLFEDLIFLIAQ
jgi:hypothetical protein